MNLVETEVEQQGDRLVCAIGSQTLEIDSEQERSRFDLARASGRRLALGIRPEALEDAAIAGNGGQTLEGLVVLTEPLGSERLAHIEVDAAPVMTEEVAEAAEDAAEVLREGLEDSRRHRARRPLRRRLARLRRRAGQVRGRHQEAPPLRPRDRAWLCGKPFSAA